MKRKLVDIIKEEIDEWNLKEKKIPQENYMLFKIEDFDYLLKYVEKYGNDYETTKFIDFCAAQVLAEIANQEQRKSIWYWESINDDFFIPHLKYLYELINLYNELKINKQNKLAYSIFRTYIEVSSQFYACLLDFEFYKKYTTNKIDDEYRKYWFKHLKPERVLSVLRKLNQELKIEYKKTGSFAIGDLRGYIYPFESEYRYKLYEKLSSFSHGNYESIKYELTNEEINELNWRITEFLVCSINLIGLSSDHFLSNNGKFDRRKHVIFQQVWYSIKYKN